MTTELAQEKENIELKLIILTKKQAHYIVGHGVFDSKEHYQKTIGKQEEPNYSAIGYTPEILKYLRIARFSNEEDRKYWP